MNYLKNILIVIFCFLFVSAKAQTFQWANSEPYSSYQTWTNKIIHDKFGNSFISGKYNIGAGNFIVKYDNIGNNLFEKNYIGYADILSLCSDSSANLYATLFISGPNIIIDGAQYDRANGNNLIIKYDPNGNMLWVKQTKLFNVLVSERTDQQDNLIVTGDLVGTIDLGNGIILSTTSLIGINYLAKFDTNGECIWAHQNDGGRDPLICNLIGDMFVIGELYEPTTYGWGSNQVTLYPSNGEQYFAKYDSIGQLIWVKQAYTCGIAPDSEGNLYNFEPDRSDIPNQSFKNVYLVKYDPQGNILWKRTHLYIDDWYKFAMKTGSDGNLYMTGGFTNYMTIDGSTIQANGNTRAFVIKIDSASTVKWISTSSGTGGAGAKDITIANGNEIYITGDMAGINTFGNYTVNQPNGGVFVAKIIDNDSNNVVTAIKDVAVSDDNSLLVYPNPSNTIFTISYQSSNPSIISFSVTDTDSKLIYSDNQKQFSGQYLKTIDLSNQPKGVYFIEIMCNGKRKSKKIVLQ